MDQRLREIQEFRRKGASLEEFYQFLLNSLAHQRVWIETQPDGKKQLECWQEAFSQIDALKHPNAWIREEALEKLEQLGISAQVAIPSICRLLLDFETSLRLKAVDLLGRLSSVSPEALDGLKLATQNEIQKVRFRAFQQIRRLVKSSCFEPKEAFELVALFFKDTSNYLRTHSKQMALHTYPQFFEHFLKNESAIQKKKVKDDCVEK